MNIPPPAPRTALDRLLRPRSIVIVGASEKPGALGTAVLLNLERCGFPGDIHLINPKRSEILGRPCRNSIADLPRGIDAAVLAVPRVAVQDSIKALADRGTGAAVIFSAGFAEDGPAGLAEQNAVAAVARAAGMAVEGPNCLGYVNHLDRVPLTFVETTIDPLAATGGRIGIVSQSGAMAAVLSTVLTGRALPLSFSISTGNEAVCGAEDFVEFLVGEPQTRVIALIVEQFRNPARFLAAARAAAAAGQRIVLLHPGKSSAARESAATHTGALAGDYAVMRLKVADAGIIFAESLEELADITEIAWRCPPIAKPGIGVIVESGAFKALTLDLCESLGVELPPLTAENAPAVRAAMPEFVGISNPLDLTAQGLIEPDLYDRTLSALVADPRIGCTVIGVIQTDPSTLALKMRPILRAAERVGRDRALVFAGLDEGAPVPSADYAAQLRQHGVPYFPTTERAIRAAARLCNHATHRPTQRNAAPITLPDLAAQTGVIPEYRAKTLLHAAGLHFAPAGMATSLEEAQSQAQRIGYPVALKAQAVALSHKSDAGGVILNVADNAAMATAWARLHANILAHDSNLSLDGVLIEAMGQRGLEMIVGARQDPDWGPVVLAGLGGVTAELFSDVRLLPPELTVPEIEAELARLTSAKLLTGFRGSPRLDVTALAELISTMGRLMLGEPRILEIDLNPVIVYPQGQGVLALDALMLVAE